MCGINGLIGFKDTGRARQLTEIMNYSLAHRGPNDAGVFVEEGVALGHRRLSIIDLSDAGHQPMMSSDKRYCISFNGEIYNFKKLKNQLKSYPFSTETDTEVLLAAFQAWGKACLEKLEGMFVFAIWDKREKELFVARDRLGIKPLYYFKRKGKLLFSSEIRGLLKTDIVPKKLNSQALVDYLKYQTVHAPATIIQEINMLMPGHYMVFKNGDLHIEEYWNLVKNRFSSALIAGRTYDEMTDHVSELLYHSVEKRLMADVPFGAFLSGGIDSSIVVGLMSRICDAKINTFSVSFYEEKFDESKYAWMVADKFDTNHTDIRLEPEDFLELVPQALDVMDHPSGDGPNTYVVSKVTKESGITVALSGLGGDEVFAGYKNFKHMMKLNQNQWVLRLPAFSRAWAGQLLKQLKPGSASTKLKDVLTLGKWDINDTYPINRQVILDGQLSSLLNGDGLAPNRVHEILNGYMVNGSGEENMQILSKVSVAEISTYMQNVLLRDTDQMSMASGLEVRVPFLDHQLIEYVLAIPDEYKYPSSPKKLLTDATDGLIPKQVINRPKMGFSLPWERWLKKDLNTFCAKYIRRLGERKIFNATGLDQLWQSFLGGDARVGWAHIWTLVVLEYWLERQGVES